MGTTKQILIPAARQALPENLQNTLRTGDGIFFAEVFWRKLQKKRRNLQAEKGEICRQKKEKSAGRKRRKLQKEKGEECRRIVFEILARRLKEKAESRSNCLQERTPASIVLNFKGGFAHVLRQVLD